MMQRLKDLRSRFILWLLGNDGFIANVALSGTDVRIVPLPESKHMTVGGGFHVLTPTVPDDFDIQALLSSFHSEPPTVH
jgi:hypothetical protein